RPASITPKGEPMTIVRTLTTLGVATMVLGAVTAAQAGQPSPRGQGRTTAAATDGKASLHVSGAPGNAAPTSGVTPGQGTQTAITRPAGSNPGASKIGHGTTK